ncbi:MAG: hypothetical protein J5I35_03210 [Methanothrix harundinacea]|nr:hypothetical protein [Methanothrix harundinacea]
MIQADLSSFAEGRDPRARVFVGEGEDLAPAVSDPPAAAYRGRRCAKCGRPLNGGGLYLVGFRLALVCLIFPLSWLIAAVIF